MFVNEQENFRKLSVIDFGLRETDTDTHVPQFSYYTSATGPDEIKGT